MKDKLLYPALLAVLVLILHTCWERFNVIIFPGRTIVRFILEPPETIFQNNKFEKMKLSISNTPISCLYKYRIRLRNEGRKEVRNLPAIIEFNGGTYPFLVYSNTKSDSIRFQVDSIKLQKTDSTRFQVKIGLLIPQEEDTLDFMTNQIAKCRVEAKSSGVSIKTGSSNQVQNRIFFLGKKLAFFPTVLVLAFCFFILGVFYSFLIASKKKGIATENVADAPYDKEDHMFDKKNAKKIKDAQNDFTYKGD